MVEDEQAIRHLVRFYSDAVSRLDPVRAASIYAEDGVVSIVGHETLGRAAIEEGMRQSFAEFALLQIIAHAGLVTVEGDRATARWSTIELGLRREATMLDCIFGRYEDDLLRTPDGWRFARRTFTMAGRTRLETAKIQINPAFFTTLAIHTALDDL